MKKSTLLSLTTISVLSSFALGSDLSERSRRDRIVVEALMRLEDADLGSNPKVQEAVKRYLASIQDDPSQIRVIRKLKISGMSDHLLDKAIQWGANSNSVQALDLALADEDAKSKLINQLHAKSPDERTLSLSRILSLSNRRDLLDLQSSLVESEEVNKAIRVEAALALSRNKGSHEKLIAIAKQDKLPSEAKVLVGASLRNSADASIKKAAEELFPLVKSTQSPLPPIEAMVRRTGDPQTGKGLYFGAATCSQCHMIGTEGKNVGPNLTEIGSKLSKDAMYVSILSPSAGISHNYEAFAVRTDEDEVITGLLVSDTPEGVTLRDAKGIERSIPRKNVQDFKKQEKSLMPENLQELLSEQGLIDLVEYMMTLRKI